MLIKTRSSQRSKFKIQISHRCCCSYGILMSCHEFWQSNVPVSQRSCLCWLALTASPEAGPRIVTGADVGYLCSPFNKVVLRHGPGSSSGQQQKSSAVHKTQGPAATPHMSQMDAASWFVLRYCFFLLFFFPCLNIMDQPLCSGVQASSHGTPLPGTEQMNVLLLGAAAPRSMPVNTSYHKRQLTLVMN